MAWFARKLCLDRSNVYRLFQRNTIDTGLLARISIILDRNFFTVLSEQVAERQNMQQ